MGDTAASSSGDLDAQVERADHLSDLGRPEEAERLLRTVLATDPAHFDATALLSWVLYKSDRDEEAYEVGARLVALAPDRALGYLRAGWALRALGRDHEAEQHARQAVRLAPHESDAHRLLAQSLATLKGRGEEALAAAEEAIRLDPGNEMNYSTLAVVLFDAEQWARAEEAMLEALARSPLTPGYRMRIGIIRCQLDRFAEAADDFMAALRQDPSPKYLKVVVDTYLSLGRPDELAGLYRLASAALGGADLADAGTVGTDPRLLQLQVDLVWKLHAGGDDARAYELVHAVLAVEPGHPQARAVLADLLAADERFDEALRIAVALRDEGHDTVEVCKTLVWARFRTASAEEALQDARAAERRHPDVPNFPNMAARFLIDLDRYQEAVECARRVVALDPDYRDGQLVLGRALHLADLPEEAVPALRTACEQYPDDTEAAFMLALSLGSLEMFDEAEAVARRGIAVDPAAGRGYAVLVHVLREQPERVEDCRWACEEVLARDPDNHEIMFALVLSHLSAGQWAQAEPHALRAHELQPDVPPYHMVAAFAHVFAGRFDVGEREIVAYLDRHGSPDHVATVASVLEDIGVPERFVALYDRVCDVARRDPIDRDTAEARAARAQFAEQLEQRAAAAGSPGG